VALLISLTLLVTLNIMLAAMLLWLIARSPQSPPGFTPAGLPGLGININLMIAAQALGFAAGVGFCALLLWRKYQVRLAPAVHWRTLPGQKLLLVVGAGVGLSFLAQLLEPLVHAPKHVPMDRMFTPHTAWVLAAYGVLLAPLFEEFFFRGLIYPSLRRSFSDGMSNAEARRWLPYFYILAGLLGLGAVFHYAAQLVRQLPASRGDIWALGAAIVLAAGAVLWVQAMAWMFRALARLRAPELLAIAVTGILFGLMHASQLADAWGPLLVLSLVGMVLTAVRAWSDSLLASTLVHAAYNGVLFVMLFIQSKGFHNFHGIH
jgi:membrane protease YdiL (CAAX protease family)